MTLVGPGESLGPEAHSANGGAGIEKADAVVTVIGKGMMGVAEVAVGDLLRPARGDLIKMVSDASRGAVFSEVALVKLARDRERIGSGVESGGETAALSIAAPAVPKPGECFSIHAVVGAVAVEEQVGVEAQAVLVNLQAGMATGEGFQRIAKAREAVVISEEVVNGPVRMAIEQGLDPGECGLDGMVFRRQLRPAEIEGVAVQHQGVDVGGVLIRGTLEEAVSVRAAGKQVEVRKHGALAERGF